MTFRLLPSQFLSAAASLAVATSVWASPMDIAERLDVAPVIEGHFVQTEKLVSIPQPFLYRPENIFQAFHFLEKRRFTLENKISGRHHFPL